MQILTNEHFYMAVNNKYAFSLKTKMIVLTCVWALVFAVFYFFRRVDWCFTLAIVAGTTFYHLAIRIVILTVVKRGSIAKYNYSNAWFREKKWEKGFYKIIGVHAWKNKFPTYEADFDINCGIESLIQASCIAEISHTIIMVLSYLPLVFAVIWGSVSDIIVFAITSVLAGAVDFMIITVQRYNRPRFVRAISR